MSEQLATRGLLDQDWKRVAQYGGICALALTFVALIITGLAVTVIGLLFKEKEAVPAATKPPLPEESNLVLRGGEMVGFVTSVARSPALGKVIGLAYTAADEAEPGSPLAIKLTSGRMVEGRVCAPHFYDPDNQRQEM